MNREKLQKALEELVDKTSISIVTEELANICFLKAAHVRENWQDHTLADNWRKACAVLSKASLKLGTWF